MMMRSGYHDEWDARMTCAPLIADAQARIAAFADALAPTIQAIGKVGITMAEALASAAQRSIV